MAHRGRVIDVVGPRSKTLARVAFDLVVAEPPRHVGRLELHRNVGGDHTTLSAVLPFGVMVLTGVDHGRVGTGDRTRLANVYFLLPGGFPRNRHAQAASGIELTLLE